MDTEVYSDEDLNIIITGFTTPYLYIDYIIRIIFTVIVTLVPFITIYIFIISDRSLLFWLFLFLLTFYPILNLYMMFDGHLKPKWALFTDHVGNTKVHDFFIKSKTRISRQDLKTFFGNFSINETEMQESDPAFFKKKKEEYPRIAKFGLGEKIELVFNKTNTIVFNTKSYEFFLDGNVENKKLFPYGMTLQFEDFSKFVAKTYETPI